MLHVLEDYPGGVNVLVLLLSRAGLLVRDPDRPPAVGDDVHVPVLVSVGLAGGCLGVTPAVLAAVLLQPSKLRHDVILALQEPLHTVTQLPRRIAMRKLEELIHYFSGQ